LLSDSNYFRNKIENPIIPKEQIGIWGDSLTGFSFQTPVGTKYFTSFLADSLGINYDVLNFGVGGEKTSDIASRQGGNQLIIKNIAGITIPTGLTAVTLELNSNILNQGTGLVGTLNPVNINGIQGNITKNGSIYSFTRLVIGSAQFVPLNTPIFTKAQLNYRGGLLVIASGTNDDKASSEQRQTSIDFFKKMIEYSKCSDYLLMAPHSHVSDYALLADLIKQEFEGKVVDIRNLFVHHGITDAIANGSIQEAINNSAYSGSNAYKHITSYDDITRISFTGVPNDYLTNQGVLDDIVLGRVPRIFMTDGTHFNLIGQQLQAKFLYDRLKLLNL